MGQNVKVGQGGNEVVLFLYSLEKMLLKLDLPELTSVINSPSFSRKKSLSYQGIWLLCTQQLRTWVYTGEEILCSIFFERMSMYSSKLSPSHYKHRKSFLEAASSFLKQTEFIDLWWVGMHLCESLHMCVCVSVQTSMTPLVLFLFIILDLRCCSSGSGHRFSFCSFT